MYYNEVQKKLVFRLFLSLGTEGKKRFLQKNPHVEVSKMSFKEIGELASTSFQKVKCVTFEKYKLSTRMQEQGETLEAFQAEITAQAARSELENEIVRDLFIYKMKNRALQDTPTFETLAPEQVPKRVTKFEHSKLTTMAFKKANSATVAGKSTSHKSGVKIKQEPILTMRSSNGSTRKHPFKSENNKRPNKIKPTTSSGQTKPCNRRGRVFDQGHLKSSPAIENPCKNCGKPGRFATMCISQQASAIMEDSDKSEEEYDLIREDFGSCSDFEIMSIQPHLTEGDKIARIVEQIIHERNWTTLGEQVSVQKVDVLRDPTSNKIKSLKGHGTDRQSEDSNSSKMM